MSFYESVIILSQDLSLQKVNDILREVYAAVEDLGARPIKKEYWGLRKLAYNVKKNESGHYLMIAMELDDKSVLNKLDYHYRMHNDVIKYMTVKVPSVEEGNSIIMQAEQQTGEA